MNLVKLALFCCTKAATRQLITSQVITKIVLRSELLQDKKMILESESLQNKDKAHLMCNSRAL